MGGGKSLYSDAWLYQLVSPLMNCLYLSSFFWFCGCYLICLQGFVYTFKKQGRKLKDKQILIEKKYIVTVFSLLVMISIWNKYNLWKAKYIFTQQPLGSDDGVFFFYLLFDLDHWKIRWISWISETSLLPW